MPQVQSRLRVNRNGVICLETTEPGLVTSKIARDLSYGLEYKTTAGEWYRAGIYSDSLTACQARREANALFRWRLVAFNNAGQVTLPRDWHPFRY